MTTNTSSITLDRPLRFAPVYQSTVWGGTRIAALRPDGDVPAGPIGESWEISQQARGDSVVVEGPAEGQNALGINAAVSARTRRRRLCER